MQLAMPDQEAREKNRTEEEQARRTQSRFYAPDTMATANERQLVIFSTGNMDYTDVNGQHHSTNCAVFAREIDANGEAKPVYIIPDLIPIRN